MLSGATHTVSRFVLCVCVQSVSICICLMPLMRYSESIVVSFARITEMFGQDFSDGAAGDAWWDVTRWDVCRCARCPGGWAVKPGRNDLRLRSETLSYSVSRRGGKWSWLWASRRGWSSWINLGSRMPSKSSESSDVQRTEGWIESA